MLLADIEGKAKFGDHFELIIGKRIQRMYHQEAEVKATPQPCDKCKHGAHYKVRGAKLKDYKINCARGCLVQWYKRLNCYAEDPTLLPA